MFDVGALILEVVYWCTQLYSLVWTCTRESEVTSVSGAP